MLLTAKIALGRSSRSEDLLHGAIAPGQVDGRFRDQVAIERQRRRIQGLAISRIPLARGGDVVRPQDHGDPAMADGDEMLDEPLRSSGAVALDQVAFDAVDGSVEQHQRIFAADERQQSAARAVADRERRSAHPPDAR